MSLNYQVKVSILASTKVKSCFDAYPYFLSYHLRKITHSHCTGMRKFKKLNLNTQEKPRIFLLSPPLIFSFSLVQDLPAQSEHN